jgi:hypothetical protein
MLPGRFYSETAAGRGGAPLLAHEGARLAQRQGSASQQAQQRSAASASTVQASGLSGTSQTSSASATSPAPVPRRPPGPPRWEGAHAAAPAAPSPHEEQQPGARGRWEPPEGSGASAASPSGAPQRPSPFADAPFPGASGAAGQLPAGRTLADTTEQGVPQPDLDAGGGPAPQQWPGHFAAAAAAGLLGGASSCAGARPPPHPSSGFRGRPAARVAAADLRLSGAKDVVVYKIRVGDESGAEWTVSRRYRHFEVLHRQLRALPAYRLKLPPKRIFFHSQNVDFVEERREALDAFLQGVLRVPQLASSGDVWEFLRAGSERFELGPGGPGGEGPGPLGVARHVLAATQSIGRGVVGMGAGVVDQIERSMTGVTDAAVGGVEAVLNEARAGLGLRHRRSASVPEGLAEFDPGEGLGAGAGAGATAAPRQRRGDPLSRAGAGLLKTATASARKVRAALAPGGAPAAASRALHFGEGSDSDGPGASASSASLLMGGSPTKRGRLPRKDKSRGASPSKAPRDGSRGGRRDPAVEALLAQRTAAFHPAAYAPLPVSGLEAAGAATGSFAFPSEAWRLRFDTAQEAAGAGGTGAARREASSLPASPSRSRAGSPRADLRLPTDGARDFEEAAGISGECGFISAARAPQLVCCPSLSPLPRSTCYSLAVLRLPLRPGFPVDALLVCSPPVRDRGLRLPAADPRLLPAPGLRGGAPGFVPGDGGRHRRLPPLPPAPAAPGPHRGARDPAHPELPVARRRMVPNLARLPRGAPAAAAGRRGAARAAAQPLGARAPGGAHAVGALPRPAVSPRCCSMVPPRLPPARRPSSPRAPCLPVLLSNRAFCLPCLTLLFSMPFCSCFCCSVSHPLDEEEVREAVGELLLRRPPAALVRLVGRTAYADGAQDVFEMMQSGAFMRQLGYGLLEIAALHLCPEMRGLFNQLEHGMGMPPAAGEP